MDKVKVNYNFDKFLPLINALSLNNNIIITGNEHTGKSTLLNKLNNMQNPIHFNNTENKEILGLEFFNKGYINERFLGTFIYNFKEIYNLYALKSSNTKLFQYELENAIKSFNIEIHMNNKVINNLDCRYIDEINLMTDKKIIKILSITLDNNLSFIINSTKNIEIQQSPVFCDLNKEYTDLIFNSHAKIL